MSTEFLSSFSLHQIRVAFLEGLSKQDRTFFSYHQIIYYLIAELFRDRDEAFRSQVSTQWTSSEHVTRVVEDSDTRKIMTVLWGFISDGILYPRFSTKNSINTPVESYYGITEHGQRVLRSLETHPSSPRFIEHLRRQAPKMSDDVVACLEDASECLHRGLLRAAIVMLGLASESTIRVTLEGLHFMSLAPEPKSKAVVLFGQLNAVIAGWSVAEEKHRLTQALAALETIRVERNQAAHPGSIVLDRDHVETLLILAANKILVFWQIPIEKAITAGFSLT